ncbi:hypothetical protein [Haloarcula montana]|uniref:hypothetical protein n=1 Tax=Haloarcula montana TaxID=3111776 RepID=UPI002D780051|nr:hypothetical protein [Haloarcula sp. GH36]
MSQIPHHCRVETALPAATDDYFAAERETLDAYLDLVPGSVDHAGDAAVGPIDALPWLYVADLTGWRGATLARLLAAQRDCPCYQLSAMARDAVPTLWEVLRASADGPVVVHLELRGDSGQVPGTLREALRRGFRQPERQVPDGRDPVVGEAANTIVVFTDTRPSKRLASPLPAATTPYTGAVLSYAPRRSMLPEQPDGTTYLAEPPAIHEREAKLESFLLATIPDTPDSEQFVGAAVDALSITHSVIGKRDLLFDVSPRLALKYGRHLETLSLSAALDRFRADILGQVPQSPGSTDLRETLADLLRE